jgi:hypothetical protein
MRLRSALAIVAITSTLVCHSYAGGPLIVAGGRFDPAVDAQPVVWNTSSPVSYRTASAGGLGKLDNTTANARVQKLFQVWEDVATAKVRFQNAGPIQPTGDYPGGAIDSIAKLGSVFFSCDSGVQTPIIFDAGGRLFDTLFGPGSGIIGFAGPCDNFDSSGHMLSGLAMLNGKWIDGNPQNGEISDNQFDQAFVHEFGHLIGLDHSQISVGVLNQPRDQCDSVMLASLPVMFPFLHCQARLDAGLPLLSADDEAWVSMLYPETVDDAQNHHVRFDSVYGIISGRLLFSDGESMAQGANLIATDQNGTPGAQVSVVSGYLFTNNPGGQHVTGNNPGDGGFGSHDPLQIGKFEIPIRAGNYRIAGEAINPAFVGGSSVGPLFPIPFADFSGNSFKVTAGSKTTGIDIVLRDELRRFDQFEGK